MLRVDRTERVDSKRLLYLLKDSHQSVVDEGKSDYILKPCPKKQTEYVPSAMKAKLNEEVRDLLLKERREQLTQRLSIRPASLRQSISHREKTKETAEGNAVPPSVLSAYRDPGYFGTDGTAPKEQPVTELSEMTRAQGLSLVPDHPSLETADTVAEEALPWEDTEAFAHRIDTTIRESFKSLELDAVHEVTFDITWQLQQCIRDELDGSPDLGPVLTVTGNSLHAWATSCHEYVQATWKEGDCGEQFLMDLEILLGKIFTTSG